MAHRRGAGVVRLALDDDLDAGDAGDRRDDADIQAPGLQHRPLLDMQFQKRPDVGALQRCKP
ncbi:hypothetical protein D9M69_714350 [compost metagenome]